MKPFLRKSRSRWEKLLLALCAFFWAGCDNSADATSASLSSDSNGGISSSSARSSSSVAPALSSSSGKSSSSGVSSSASLDQCTLEYDETLLQKAVDEGAITDKSTCDLSNFIALYGSPAVFDSLEALNARTTLVYEPGVGCFRCPNDASSSSAVSASSSSKENDSSSSAVSSSSAEDPASSSSFGSVAPLYGVPMDDNS
jgi:hypothetical protein